MAKGSVGRCPREIGEQARARSWGPRGDQHGADGVDIAPSHALHTRVHARGRLAECNVGLQPPARVRAGEEEVIQVNDGRTVSGRDGLFCRTRFCQFHQSDA